MVRTRHSGEGDVYTSPKLVSLTNEKLRKKTTEIEDHGQDDYNIFEDKLQESRLRPRVGPGRAYNYLDADSSDDDSYRRRRTSQEHESERNPRYRRSREIKQEMIDHDQSHRSRRRLVEPPEDPASVTEEEEEDSPVMGRRRSSRNRRQVYDTLNQSYILSYPPKRKDENGDNEEHSDDDKPQENGEFSDMYSRVKRKRSHIKRNMYGVPIEDSDDSDQEVTKRLNTNNSKRSMEEGEEEEEEEEDNEDEEEEEEEDTGKGNDRQTRSSNRRLSLRKRTRQPVIVKSYSLREHKPRTVLYTAPVIEPKVRRADHSIFSGTPTKKNPRQTYQSPAQRRHFRKRSAFHSSSSSTSSSTDSDSDEEKFKHRKSKSMAKARSRLMPMNFSGNAMPSSSVIKDRVKSGASLADVEPMTIDKNVTFNSIGGLGKHIRALKEMVVFPLLYDKVFQRFKVDPPRGVLFYGPPGTGKTLVARALANECSQGDKKVAFFMRKGADCLSKWVGESERQLRLLFDQAYKFRPSIIFFDEIDGLAPVRSSRQDQIHSSIVSTLLALMDGLDSRGEIVVIGATNRIDSLDPALRRPGRFDREFLFPLPSMEARKQILKIHTSSWNPKLNDHFLSELAEKCVGYCGADLKALCTEAAMFALRRRYPQIYISNEALQLDESSIQVSAKDFFDGVNNIIPTSQRSVNTPARALNTRICPLLQRQLDKVMDQLADSFPLSLGQTSSLDAAATSSQAQDLAESGAIWDEMASDEDEDAPSIFVGPTTHKGNNSRALCSIQDSGASTSQGKPAYLNFTSFASSRPVTFRPRIMLVGQEGQGQTTHIAPAVVHKMESLPVHVLDLPALYAVTAKTPEESCANVFHEAKRKCPSIVYLPYISQWWDVMADTLRATLLTLIQDLDPSLPLLLLATSEQPYHTLDPMLQSLFCKHAGEVVTMSNPSKEEREDFFKDLLMRQACRPPPRKKQAGEIIQLLKESKKALRLGYCHRKKTHFGQKKRSRRSKGNSSRPRIDRLCLNDVHMAKPTVVAKSQLKSAKIKAQSKVIARRHHHMVLRRRSNLSRLNRNQSAKDSWDSFESGHIFTSPSPSMFYRAGPVRGDKSDSRTFLKPCLPLKNFRSNRDHHHRQAKPRSSECSDSLNIESTSLSTRHMRYLRRHGKYGFDYAQPGTSSVLDVDVRRQKSVLSCGSFLMLNRKDEMEDCFLVQDFPSNLSLPINFRELQSNRKMTDFKPTHKYSSVKIGPPTKISQIVEYRACHKYNLRHAKTPNYEIDLKPVNEMRAILRHHRYNLRSRMQRAQRMLEVLPKAGPSKPRELTKEELKQLHEKEELTLMELRIFLRDVINKLGNDKKFTIFAKPVNIDDAPDYYEVIEQPMDLSTMMAKIDLHEYNTVHAFIDDINLICSNALEYNPNRGPMDRVIRHRACALKDTAYAIIKTELDKDFEKMCMEIEESRKRRGEKSNSVPNFYRTRPAGHPNGKSQQSVIPNYLDQPKPVRHIPQPEGERYSRRVRGLTIDPAPPLETVEKVYKAGRSSGSPIRDASSNAKANDTPNSNNSNTRGLDTANNTRDLSSRKPGSNSKVQTSTPKVSTTKPSASSTQSSNKDKRKRLSKCVWCRPRRKRPRLAFSRPPQHYQAAKRVVEEEEVEEERMEENEADTSQEAESSQETSSTPLTEQLQVDVPQENAEAKGDVKSPRPPRLRSPSVTSPLGVTTRRSSMSPRSSSQPGPVSPLDSHKEVEEEKTSSPAVATGSPSKLEENPLKGLPQLAKAAVPEVPSTDQLPPAPSTDLQSPLASTGKPSVVKRLDMDTLLPTDSGLGSSVDSNGDSRDSLDHNPAKPVEAKVKEGNSDEIKDTNQNCNPLVKERATAILREAPKTIQVDMARLRAILHKLVSHTDGFTVERLEKIYSQLSMIIYRHRHNNDRTAMIVDLEAKTEELTRHSSGPSTSRDSPRTRHH